MTDIVYAVNETVRPIRLLGAREFQLDGHLPTLDETIQHLNWMAHKTIQFVDDQQNDKANRWLGFIQGSMWAFGYHTINELRAINSHNPQGAQPMSTHDVPGANPSHADVLAAGCWAEHTDGSLIYVKGTEGGMVVYEIYDMAVEPPISYTDAMQEAAFKQTFSWKPTGTSKELWTWHDKTPFPWDKVMQNYGRPRPGLATAQAVMSAAARVAQSLGLRGKKIAEEDISHRADRPGSKSAQGILERIAEALENIRR